MSAGKGGKRGGGRGDNNHFIQVWGKKRKGLGVDEPHIDHPRKERKGKGGSSLSGLGKKKDGKKERP